MPRGSGMPPTRRRRPRCRRSSAATPAQIETILRQRLAGTWTPPPPTPQDDPEYHRLYARWQQENSPLTV